MTEKPKPKRRRRRRGKARVSPPSWSAKHAARVEFYPGMKELIEWMKPFAVHADITAQDMSMKHGLDSHVSLLIALREVLNQRIANEVKRIMFRRGRDDLADIKVLLWQTAMSARSHLSKDGNQADIHLADGLHPQAAAAYDGVKIKDIQ